MITITTTITVAMVVMVLCFVMSCYSPSCNISTTEASTIINTRLLVIINTSTIAAANTTIAITFVIIAICESVHSPVG